MRVISLCADGIRDAAERGFYDWIAEQDADIICVQNVQCSEYDLPNEPFFPPEYNVYFFESENPQENGVAIYCRQLPKAIMTGVGFTDFDMEGRYIQADYGDISIGCLLAPSAYPSDQKAQARKNQFYDLFYNHLQKIKNKRRDFIICGNWNIAHRNLDLQDAAGNQGISGAQPEEQQWMDSLIRELGYVDAFRQYNGDPDEFTWWPDGNRDENGWRVDYQIVSERLKSKVEYGVIYKNQEFAQHAPVIVDYDIELPENPF